MDQTALKKTKMSTQYFSPHNKTLPTNFINREEYYDLQARGEALDSKLKFRREYEQKYHSIKLEELDQEIENIKESNAIAKKRNEEILNSLQKDIYKCYQVSKISQNSKNLLEVNKKRYSDYLTYQVSSIRNEFQLRMVVKQNELIAMRTVLENQLNQNEEILKMENEYSIKMARMNSGLASKVKDLMERNKKIEDERRNIMRNYAQMEEKAREAIQKSLQRDDEYKEEVNIVSDKIQPVENRICEKKEEKKSNQEKKMIVYKEQFIEMNLNHQEGKLDELRRKKLEKELKMKREKEGGSEMIIIDKSIPLSESIPLVKQAQAEEDKKIINHAPETVIKQPSKISSQSDAKSKAPEVEINSSVKIVNVNDQKQNSMIDIGNTFIKDATIMNVASEEIKNKKEEGRQKPEEEVEDNPKEIQVKEGESKDKKTHYELLMEEKPELNNPKVPKDYKIQILRRIIPHIEKQAKSQKPGAVIYSAKHINTANNKALIKSKFYELYSMIQEKPDTVSGLITAIDLNLHLQMVFELLNSNPEPSLAIDTLKVKDYNEALFDNSLDMAFKDVIDIVFDHIKRMLSEKRVTMEVAINFLGKGLMNFAHDNLWFSRLIRVLEMKLSQKGKPLTSNAGVSKSFSGFQNNSNFQALKTITNLATKENQSASFQKSKNDTGVFAEYD